MRAGALRYRFTLYEPSEVNTSGDVTVVYTAKGTAWGSLEARGGLEGQLLAEAHYESTLRNRSDVTTRWRLVTEGRTFEVTEPPQDPSGKGSALTVRHKELKA
jgi:head-tail adaptor